MKTQSGEASEETNTSPLYNSEEEFQEIENVEYNLGTCVGPQLFQEHVNNNAPDELDRCLQKGLACATIIGNELGRPKQANWLLDRLLQKGCDVEQTKSLLEYLQTIAEPPEYPVCKKFLDDLLFLINELDLDHIFVHSNEQVYARLAHIIWKEPQFCKNIILMGGFHKTESNF